VNDRPKWRTVVGGGRSYVKKIAAQLEHVYLNSPVNSVTRTAQGVTLEVNGETLHFDEVIFACHAPDTLNILQDATADERHLLANARYQANSAFLHTDSSLLPKNKKVWSAWNYLSNSFDKNVDENADAGIEEAQPVCVSYLLNHLQDIQLDVPVIVTLNPTHLPASEKILAKFDYQHPIFDQAAIHAQNQLHTIQGLNHTWFAGAWTGYGFHEDGLKSALRIVEEFDCQPSWAKI
jgi:predicted NAD/FAD-binding protein